MNCLVCSSNYFSLSLAYSLAISTTFVSLCVLVPEAWAFVLLPPPFPPISTAIALIHSLANSPRSTRGYNTCKKFFLTNSYSLSGTSNRRTNLLTTITSKKGQPLSRVSQKYQVPGLQLSTNILCLKSSCTAAYDKALKLLQISS